MSSEPIRILVMEDEPVCAELIRTMLAERGYAVTLAADGEEGLRLCRRGGHDLLVIDHWLPKRSGLEVIRTLQEEGAMPPVIVVSGLGQEEVAATALKLGAADYIPKDGRGQYLELLVHAVEHAITRRKHEEAMGRAAEEQERLLSELKQRVRELGCLYGTEKLLAEAGQTPEVVLQGIINLIPHAAGSEDRCAARIKALGQTFETTQFRETPWTKTFSIEEQGQPIGRLDVASLDRPPDGAAQPFSAEQEELFFAIADQVGRFIERWHTQEQLLRIHEELRKLSRAVSQSASGVVITDRDGRIEYVNPKFCEMTGYSPREVIGKNPRILKSGDKKPAAYRELWETIQAGREWTGEFHNRKKDGTLYWDHSTISPVTDAYGTITHFVAVKEDVTRWKEAERLRHAVLKISTAVAGCRTEDEISRVVVEGIRVEMDIDRCALFLGEPAHPPFRGTYGTDMRGRTVSERDHLWTPREDQDISELLAGAPFKSGFPLGEPDEILPGEEHLSATLIPLRQGGRVFGMITVDNRITRRPVGEVQLNHITLLAEVIGNALQVARAQEALKASVEQTERANQELETFNQAMVGREARVIELKEEVNRLLTERGESPRYPPVWEQAGAGRSRGGGP